MLSGKLRDDHKQFLMRATQKAVEDVGRSLLRVRLDATRETQSLNVDYDIDLTEDQKAVLPRTRAFTQLRALAVAAYEQKGIDRVVSVLAAASAFYRASGMPFRHLESARTSRSFSKDKDSPVRNEEALSSLHLWSTPRLTPETGTLGPNSMLTADREELRQAAASYFLTGVRCAWFEKMLVEALVAAEAHATTLEFRRNPLTRGHSGLLRVATWAYVFHRSRGESPAYEFWHLGLALVTFLVSVTVLGGLTLYSFSLIDRGREWQGYIGIAAAAWVGANWAGRFLTQRVLLWASNPLTRPIDGAAKMLNCLNLARQVALDSTLNLKLAQDALSRAAATGIAFDQIAYGLIGRGIAAGEVMWMQESNFELDGDWYDILAEFDLDT